MRSLRFWSRKKKVLISLSALIIAAFVIASYRTRWRATQPFPMAMEEGTWSYATALSPDGNVIAASLMPGWTSPSNNWIHKILPRFGLSSGGSSVPSPPIPGGWNTQCAAELRSAGTGKFLRPLQAPSSVVSSLTRPVFSPDGRFLAMTYSDNESIKKMGSTYVTNRHILLWDVASGKILWKTRYAELHENLSGGSPQWTPNGKFLLVDGEELRLFDAQTGKRLRTLAKGYYQWTYCRLSPDSTRIVTTGEGVRPSSNSYVGPRLTIVRDLSGRVLRRVPGQKTADAFWSRDGKTLVQVLGSSVRGWDESSQQIKWTLPAPKAYSVVLSSDGKQIAWITCQIRPGCTDYRLYCASSSTLQVWDVVTRRMMWKKTVPGCLDFVRFSPDGKLLAGAIAGSSLTARTASDIHNEFQMWDSLTGVRQRVVQQAGQSPVLIFSRDNKQVLLETTTSLVLCPLK